MKVDCFGDENDIESESGGRLVVVLHRHSNGYRRYYHPLALVFFPLPTYLGTRLLLPRKNTPDCLLSQTM